MKNITQLISRYIKASRLRLNKTQKELAEEAGISLMTLRRAEAAEMVSLESLVTLMEIFGDLEGLKNLFIFNETTPRDFINPKHKARKRVRKKRVKENKKEVTPSWVWGDEIND